LHQATFRYGAYTLALIFRERENKRFTHKQASELLLLT